MGFFSFLAAAKNTLSSVVQSVAQTVKSVLTAVKDGVKSLFKKAKKKAKDVVSKVRRHLKPLKQKLKDCWNVLRCYSSLIRNILMFVSFVVFFVPMAAPIKVTIDVVLGIMGLLFCSSLIKSIVLSLCDLFIPIL
ncbi:hypothetical protein Droror1_Dr00023684 [Drosera rotundifolia]